MKSADTKKSLFAKNVVQLIRKIPRGKIATFGQIAELAGKPGGGRIVGWILKTQADTFKLPWHRVMNAGGKVFAPAGTPTYLRQKRLLKAEGVEFRSAHNVDVSKYQWLGPHRKASASRPKMFSD